jgi:hypothetical protein
MNNIYVDELPKDCSECQFCDKENDFCEVLGQCFRDGYDYADCPLKSINDRLAEKDELLEDYRQLVSKLKEELGNIDCEYKTQIFTLKRTLIDECKEHRDFCRIADEKVKGLEQQLAEERKKMQELKNWCDENFNWVGDGTGYDGQDYNEMIGSNNTINKLREFLNQIQGDGNNENKKN